MRNTVKRRQQGSLPSEMPKIEQRCSLNKERDARESLASWNKGDCPWRSWLASNDCTGTREEMVSDTIVRWCLTLLLSKMKNKEKRRERRERTSEVNFGLHR